MKREGMPTQRLEEKRVEECVGEGERERERERKRERKRARMWERKREREPSAFSKTSLNIWKFTVHVLLETGLENFEHYFTSV